MNETWVVQHAAGGGVLRRHRSTELEAVRFEHKVINHVRASGLPVPHLLPCKVGDSVVEYGGRLYTLYSLEPGEHAERGRAGERRACAAGETLAHVHRALATLDGGPDDTDAPSSAPGTVERFDELERRVRSMGSHHLTEFVLTDLDDRRRWLARHGTRSANCPGDPQVIHGDYQLTNILFIHDTVSAVIDWDKARRASPVMEVVRALDHGLELDSADCRAFLTGYRSVLSLPDEVLRGGVEYWTQQQARSVWVLESAVVDGDSRVAEFLRPFRPFDQRWAEAGVETAPTR